MMFPESRSNPAAVPYYVIVVDGHVRSVFDIDIEAEDFADQLRFKESVEIFEVKPHFAPVSVFCKDEPTKGDFRVS